MTLRIERPFTQFGSIRALAGHLQVNAQHLAKLAGRADAENYRVVEHKRSIDPRLPDKIVYDSRRDLKEVQQRVNERVFKELVYPPYIIGGIPGRNVKQAIEAHLHARSLMTFDVSRFFETTAAAQVRRTLQLCLQCPPEVAELLTALTTVAGHLPRGAPTSTYIANLIFFDDEPELVSWLESYSGFDFRYTRWIDDITITSRHPLTRQAVFDVTGRVHRMLRRHGLQFQREKRVPLSVRAKRRVAYDSPAVRVHNIEIRGDQVSVRKRLRRAVRGKVHRLSRAVREQPLNENDQRLLQSLTSKVGYMVHFHPEMDELIAQLADIRRLHRRYAERDESPT